MSTRNTLKSDRDDHTGVGFNLFTDWLDECRGEDVVGLRLDGVPFEAHCRDGRLSIELTLPRKMAEKLGLLSEPREQLDAGSL
jgi:hypothetical protein